MWKRIAAWMFDGILLSVLGVGLCFLMSGLLGYDNYSKAVENAYAQYENEISLPLHTSLTDEEVFYIIENYTEILKEYIR